ncbi:MAG: hypothetical protein ACM3IJ_05875 [Candidatus Levyibacteriota bacterium]
MEDIIQNSELIKKTSRIKIVKEALRSFHRNPKFYIGSFIWSVVSTAFGLFFFFQLQAQYNAEHQKNQTLERNLFTKERELKDLEKNSATQEISQSRKILSDTISVFDNIIKLPITHKKLPDFKRRVSVVLSYLASKNLTYASSELQKLTTEVNAEIK